MRVWEAAPLLPPLLTSLPLLVDWADHWERRVILRISEEGVRYSVISAGTEGGDHSRRNSLWVNYYSEKAV